MGAGRGGCRMTRQKRERKHRGRATARCTTRARCPQQRSRIDRSTRSANKSELLQDAPLSKRSAAQHSSSISPSTRSSTGTAVFLPTMRTKGLRNCNQRLPGRHRRIPGSQRATDLHATPKMSSCCHTHMLPAFGLILGVPACFLE